MTFKGRPAPGTNERGSYTVVETSAAERGCWIYNGTVMPNGYGSDGGRPAHVVAYEHVLGPVPDGLELHHVCEIQLCVNPMHLVALTTSQHRRIHVAAITHCPHDHPYTPANTRFRQNGSRVCVTCDRLRSRTYAKDRYDADPEYRLAKGGRA